MTSFLKEARAFTNHEGVPCVELKYYKYDEKGKHVTIPMLFETSPLHGWTELKSLKRPFRYDEFLNTMIEKNLKIRRHMVEIALENVLHDNTNINSLLRIMNSIKIVDSSFVPPIINKKRKWQRNLVYETCAYTFSEVVNACMSEERLDSLFIVLNTIEDESIL